MKEIIIQILSALLIAAITYLVVCAGVFLFALQFGFEWSFLLSACAWIALIAAKYVFGNSSD